MSEEKRIRYGSIIHLENGAMENGRRIGGYLGAHGSVIEEEILEWLDPAVLSPLFTHKFENKRGSGSWEIISERGFKPNDPLKYGDAILLKNMAPNAGYLDQFDQVPFLPPFERYKEQMRLGMFTLSRRMTKFNKPTEEGPEWIVVSADGKKEGEIVLDGDNISLQSSWLRARISPEETYLTTYDKLSNHEMFQGDGYAGERMFVFVGKNPTDGKGSAFWNLTLSSSSKNFYHLWGKSDGKWLDFGALQLNQQLSKSLVGLIAERQSDDSLEGKVSYAGEGLVKFVATKDQAQQDNSYFVEHFLNPQLDADLKSGYPNGEWTIGAWQNKKIEAINISSADGGLTLSGTITFSGDTEPTSILATLPSTKAFKSGKTPLLYDFFKPEDWISRIEVIFETLSSQDKDIDDIIASIKSVGISDKTSRENQINNLKAIRKAMYDFWKEVTDRARGEIGMLAKQNILPPVNTISKLIRNITIDVEIVERAIQQRQPTSENIQADSLLMTDRLAFMSLAPFKKLLANGAPVTPVTYFDKSIYIRLVPYSDQFIFIGLTYDLAAGIHGTSTPPFDLMAIPHEIGHFIYHYPNPGLPGKATCPECGATRACPHDHSRSGSKPSHQHHGHAYKHRSVQPNTFSWMSLDKEIENNPYHHWCEEIFADLYGCMVSGPFTVLGIQSVLATSDKQRLLMDDVQHPSPMVRPYLVSDMLRVLAELDDPRWKGFKETAMILDANWTAILDRWGITLENVFNGRPASIIVPSDLETHLEPFTRVNIDSVLKHGRVIIEYFAKALLKHIDPGANPWCSDQETLNHYAVEFNNLIKKQQGLVSNTFLPVIGTISAKEGLFPQTLKGDKNYVQIGENLFKTVNSIWHDGGAGGSSGGMH